MKKIILFTLIFISSCYYDYNMNSEVVQTKQVNDGWQPNEVIKSKQNMRLSPEFRSTSIYREGTTPSDFVYRYFYDGSGSISWDDTYSSILYSFDHKKDKMDDIEKSSISSKYFLFFYKNKKISSICIFSHDFPYRKAKIRLDNGPVITTDYDGCISPKYFNNFLKADKVLVRYYVFPYDYYREGEESLIGLKDADDLLKFIGKNINKLSFDLY